MLGSCNLRLVLWERVTYKVVCVGELRLKTGIVGEGHIQSGLCWGWGGVWVSAVVMGCTTCMLHGLEERSMFW